MFYRIQPQLWEKTLLGEGEPVLLCRCRTPELSALEPAAQRRINGWYACVQRRFQHWCEKRLYSVFEQQRRSARANSRPFEPGSACLDFEDLTEKGSDCLTVRLMLGGQGVYAVQATQQWSLRDGLPPLCSDRSDKGR
jgi:hypothetical protein